MDTKEVKARFRRLNNTLFNHVTELVDIKNAVLDDELKSLIHSSFWLLDLLKTGVEISSREWGYERDKYGNL